MILSIIIPTFNRKELLSFGLQSIARQNTPWPYEIIVLNEYCEDGTKEICQEYPNIRYVLTRPNATPENVVWRVPGVAINIGVKLATSPNIIVACPEMYLMEDNVITNLVTPLLSNSKVMTYTQGYDDRQLAALYALRNGTEFPKLRGYSQGGKFWDLCTIYPFFLGMNRQEVISIGGYDEDFQEGYCFDDADFVYRMVCNGCTQLKVPGTVVHLYHSRLRYNLPEKKKLWDRNEKLYKERYGKVVRNVGKAWGELQG